MKLAWGYKEQTIKIQDANFDLSLKINNLDNNNKNNSTLLVTGFNEESITVVSLCESYSPCSCYFILSKYKNFVHYSLNIFHFTIALYAQ